MKRIIAPLVHAAFLLPSLAIAMAFIELIARKFNLIPNYIAVFGLPYVFLTISCIVIFSILLFWLANRLMRALEKSKESTNYDHFRQTIFYYFILIFCLSNWIFTGFSGGENDVYFVTLSIISIVAITLNYYFLFSKRKRTSVN